MLASNVAAAGQYLTFLLGSQFYGLPISSVREINRMSEISPVPKAAAFVAGVMNLRGKVIPVVVLRLKFGMSAVAVTKETCIIVIDSDHGQIGMIVDAVSGVATFTTAQIEPAPMMGDREAMNFIIGMGKEENRVIVLVDTALALAKDSFTLCIAPTEALKSVA